MPPLRSAYLVGLAIVVAVFVALYPYLAAMDRCEVGECPYAAQTCVSAVLTVGVVIAFAASRGHRIFAVERPSAEPYLSPDPPPPRLSPSL
jgi:hypothetical protein